MRPQPARPALVLLAITAVVAVVATVPACGDGKRAAGTDGGATGGRMATGGGAGDAAATGGQPATGGQAETGGNSGSGGVGTAGSGGTAGTTVASGGSSTGGAPGGSAGMANANGGAAGAAATRAWTMPAAITPQASAGNDLSADVAMNADGEGVVTWLRGAVVMARRYHGSTGSWDDEKVVGGKASPGGTDVGIDAAGNALVVWTDDSASNNLSIWWSRSSANGSTWSAPRRLTATRFMTPPHLAVGANGAALVTWGENINDQLTVRSCDFKNGEWNTTINRPKEGTSNASSDPRVAVDAAGKGWLIWQQPRMTDQDDWVNRIWVQRYDAGWQPATVAILDDTDTTDLKYEAAVPTVALNDAGVGVALWLERGTTSLPGTEDRLWARRWDGSKWLPQEILSRGTFEFHPGPQGAVGADGTIVAAWAQIQATAYQATAARFRAGAVGWDVSRSVETNNLSVNPNREWVAPAVGVDGQGNAVMAWRKKLDAPMRLVPTTSRLAAASVAWDPDHGVPLRDNGAATLATVGLAVARNGTVLAIWSAGNDGVWASVYK